MSKNFLVKKILSLVILSSVMGLASCNSNNGKDSNSAPVKVKPKIVASHSILCDLVQTIAEDTVDLTCLIDGNQDPHTYTPTPSQLRAIEKAQLILYGGYQLEPQIIKLIAATKTSTPKIAVYEQVVSKPILAEHEHSEAEHSEAEHSEADPHVWHNVKNAIAMIELIQPMLWQLNPSQKAKYIANSQVLSTKLEQLDSWINKQILTIPQDQRILVTTHDSFNYYAQAYPLEEYKTLQGLSSEVAPTASQLKNLTTEIKQTGVSTIFVEATNSDRIMSNVARAADVELASEKLIADGLGEADNYIAMISNNTCAIVEGLKGKCQTFK
jgi:manganese/iron transport system substrate-binding protein